MNGATTRTRKNYAEARVPVQEEELGTRVRWLTLVPSATMTASRIAATNVANIAP